MWGKHKKLEEWVAAGLLSEDQAQAIQAHENVAKEGRFGRKLTGLGIFAILVGILSIIAANWYAIPGTIKITVHVLLNALVAFAAWQADNKGKEIWREGAVAAFFGLTLTLIILIGQVYQLDGTVAGALILWMAIVTPFVLIFGQSYMTSVPWMLGLLATIWAALFEYVEDLPREWQAFFAFGISGLLPLALMADGSFAPFQRCKPALANVFLKTGFILAAFGASISLAFWEIYDEFGRSMPHVLDKINLLLPIGLAGLFVHAAFHQFYRNDIRLRMGALFAGVSFVAIIAPYLWVSASSDILSALLFIGYWIFAGWVAQGLGYSRVLSLAITLIAIRIFVIYVQVFGTMLDTGIGLIVGGVVMLSLIWIARRLNRRLTGRGISA